MIDVSEIVRDPDFTVSCVLIRQQAKPLGNGRDEITKIRKPIQAVLQPLNDAQLVNIVYADGSPVTCGLTYYGVERVSLADEGFINDQIEFQGVLYDVMSIADYNPNGAYYRATLARSKQV